MAVRPPLAALAVLVWLSLGAAVAGGPGSMEGQWLSGDGRFRAIVYERGGLTRVILYGSVGPEGRERRFVAPALSSRWSGDALQFVLPPRPLYAGQGTGGGLAGHRSELPPQAVAATESTWVLRPAASSLVLDCVPADRLACGIEAPVPLFPSSSFPAPVGAAGK